MDLTINTFSFKWTFIRKNGLNPFQANVIKYVCRYLFKGKSNEDLNKIKHYCDLEIEHLKNIKKEMIEDKRLSEKLLKNHYEWCKENGRDTSWYKKRKKLSTVKNATKFKQ